MSSRSNCTRHAQYIYQSLTLVETRTRSITATVVTSLDTVEQALAFLNSPLTHYKFKLSQIAWSTLSIYIEISEQVIFLTKEQRRFVTDRHTYR